MGAFVAGWSKEFHSKEHLPISYIIVHVICIHVENKVSKIGDLYVFRDPNNRRNY